MGDVTLYHWEPNANSGKPMLALMEKGVPFESRYIDLLNFDQHKPDYLALNPLGTIPAMTHGGRVLTESTAIMEYVDEAFDGPSLMPAAPRDRWRVRWWMKFLDQWLAPSFSMIGWSVFIGPSVRQRDPEVLEAAIERIPMEERRLAWRKAIYGRFSAEEMAESQRRVALGIGMLEKALGERPWLATDAYSLADINAFNLVYILPHMADTMKLPSVSVARTPATMAWLRRMYQRPSIRRTWEHSRGGIQIDIEAEANRQLA